MVTKQADPVAWALLMFELNDAQDGLQNLMQEMTESGEFDESVFRIHMAHIYTHLNRAWNGRIATADNHSDDTLWNKWAEFPTDLGPFMKAF